MTINFPELARQAAADGAITPEEVLALRRSAWPDGRIDETEAEAILAINDVVSAKSAEWIDFLVEAVGEYVLNGTEPRGYVADETADWMIATTATSIRPPNSNCSSACSKRHSAPRIASRTTPSPRSSMPC